MGFSPEQLEAAMKGSELMKRATEQAFEAPEDAEMPQKKEKSEEEPEGEDVDLTELEDQEMDKAA